VAGLALAHAAGWQRGRRLIGLAGLGFAAVAILPVGPLLLRPLETRFSRPASLPERIDGILLLGGAVSPRLSLAYGETVFNAAVGRVLAAAALARRHPEARLAVLGGEGELLPVGFSEGRATLAFLVDSGIEPARIVLEEASRNTRQSAVFAKDLLAPGPAGTWVLVTSGYHMPRAVAVFRAIDWRVIPYPVDFRTDPQSLWRVDFDLVAGLAASTVALKEWVGLVAYRLFGWTRELFPGPSRGAAFLPRRADPSIMPSLGAPWRYNPLSAV
jgi:uncharacterized SAM-binding protein YcdF (DUF218 family)